jgi:hypothetical protein
MVINGAKPGTVHQGKGCVFDSSDAGVPRGCQLNVGMPVGPERAEGSLNAFGISLKPRPTPAAGMEKREAVLKRPFKSWPEPR